MKSRVILASMLAGAISIFALSAGAQQGSSDPVDPKKVKDDLAHRELVLSRQYADFEQALLKLAQRLKRTGDKADAQRAAVLERALEASKNVAISLQFEQLVQFLKEKDLANLGEADIAVKKTNDLADHLRDILNRIKEDPVAGKNKDEMKSIKDVLKRLDQVIRDQERIQGLTEIGKTPKEKLSDEQKKVIDATNKVGKDIAKLGKGGEAKEFKGEAKEGGKANDKGEAKDQGKNGESNKGEAKDQGKDSQGKQGEAKGGEPKAGKDGPQAEAKGGQKGAEGKDGEAKAGDPKAGDPKAGDPKSGDPKAGEAKGGDPKGDPKAGDPKAGEAKGGDPKGGDPKAGDPKAGEAKAGDPKGGDPKGGEAKAGKPGEGKPGEGKDGGKGKPGEGKPGEAKGGEGKGGEAKDGGGGKGGEAGKDKGGPPPNPKDDNAITKKKVQDAEGYEKSADENINNDKKPDAVDNQDKAIKELNDAKKKLEQLLKQLREEELERLLAALQGRCEKMLRMQIAVYNGTQGLSKFIETSPDMKPSRDNQQASIKLSDQEKDIVLEATKAIEMLEAEGSAVAFPEVFQQVREDMKHVQRRLEVTDVGIVTQAIEKDIIDSLGEMIEALKKAKQELDAGKSPPPGPPGKPPPQADQKLLDQIAELKMIRSLQLRVNTRTETYGKMYVPKEGEQASDAAIRRELQNLSERQVRIFEVTNKIAKGENK